MSESELLVKIVLPGLPTAWARAGRGKGFTFTPKKQRGAMADFKVVASAAMAGRSPFDGPLALTLQFTYPWPASLSAKKRAAAAAMWRAARPDLDNLTKLVGDALNGIVWRDDAAICSLVATKTYSESASTTIVVRGLT